MLKVLMESITDEPRVADNICWAVHNLAAVCQLEAKNPFGAHIETVRM